MLEGEAEREGDKGAEEELGEGGPLLLATTARPARTSGSRGTPAMAAVATATETKTRGRFCSKPPGHFIFILFRSFSLLTFLFYK